MATTISNVTVFTSAEAASHAGLDSSLICRYCRMGTLKAEKIGRDWIIKKTDLDAFLKVPREPGNPNFSRRK